MKFFTTERITIPEAKTYNKNQKKVSFTPCLIETKLKKIFKNK